VKNQILSAALILGRYREVGTLNEEEKPIGNARIGDIWAANKTRNGTQSSARALTRSRKVTKIFLSG